MKLMKVEQAVGLIRDGSWVAVDGFAGIGCPELVLTEIERSFLETGHPRGLTLLGPAGQGNARGKGLDHFAHEGLVERVIGSYFNLTRNLGQMILEEKCEAYQFPLGVVSQLFRESAAGRPGLVTHVGLNTFVDPRFEGGKMNARTREDLVEVVQLNGRVWLFYPAPRVDVAIVRGTTADETGNITMEREGAYYNGLAMAQAAKRWGGIVIAQVERVARAGTLNPKQVKIPGILVDAVVVADPEHHPQGFRTQYNPGFSGEIKMSASTIEPLPLDARKVVGRRAALELRCGAIVNIGVGMPEFVASIAGEEGVSDRFTLTVENGPVGGVPAYGLNFGLSLNAEAIVDMPSQFDFYDGGGIDITFVGFAQADREGNVNVSKLSRRIPGVGGFLNVTQNAKKVVFCGAFTAEGGEVLVRDGRVQIVENGAVRKFVNQLDQVTFSGRYATEKGQEVLLVTERCVFRLVPEGLELSEYAPGVDVERDILALMEFAPKIAADLKEMPAQVFYEGPMGLASLISQETYSGGSSAWQKWNVCTGRPAK